MERGREEGGEGRAFPRVLTRLFRASAEILNTNRLEQLHQYSFKTKQKTKKKQKKRKVPQT